MAHAAGRWIGLATLLASTGVLASENETARSAQAALEALVQARPGVRVLESGDRVSRVYGRPVSEGPTAAASAETFRVRHARVFGVEPQELMPELRGAAQAWEQPVLYLPDEGRYRFTALPYRQSLGGVPVFRSRLVLLVRNDEGHPLVLASADLRDVSGLGIDPANLPPADERVIAQVATGVLGAGATIIETEGVIWAGVDDMVVAPRLAHSSLVANGVRRWLIVTDAFTGELLYEEDRIKTIDILGTIEGLSTEGVGSEQCEEEIPMVLPYARITAGPVTAFADENGSFSFPAHNFDPISVTATLDGLWFDVINVAGAEASVTLDLLPDMPGVLLLNESNSALERAEVNAYVAANDLRDIVLAANPFYPAMNENGFTVRVNRSDGLCPGNAWYSPDEGSINFCQAGGGHPNTAWSSVVYHEYGHHLVEMAGSGQGAYGEGMGDCMSVIMLDSPELGLGFYGSCFTSLRDAENSCQYQSSGCSSCGSTSHSCGQLLSGCVWDLREELFATEPDTYLQTLSSLVINSILVHTGSTISPSITIDFLTLDDDNGDLGDGTPHYEQIAAAFDAHDMPAPPLAPIAFAFPEGLPTQVSPFGGGTVLVEVLDIGSFAEPGTGTIHLSTTGEPGSFTAALMTEIGPNLYEAVFPEAECATLTHYYFSAQSMGGATTTYPASAPDDALSVISATASELAVEDTFERDTGWTVTNDGGLSDGAWELGTPVGGGDRGDPPVDADGSGQCALTDNVDGNSDVDNGSTMLTSPVIDATGGTSFVSYWRWYSNSSGTGAFQDVFEVEVSADGGGSWVPLESVGPEGPEVSGGWFYRQFRIDQYVEPTDQFRIRFVASDTSTPSIVEAGIDGFSVRRYSCDPPVGCSGDVNGDDVVGVDDLLAVIVAWGSDDPVADVTQDGIVDVEDLVLVVLEWGPCL